MKVREFQKNICFIDYTKVFVWITTNCGRFLKRWEYQRNLRNWYAGQEATVRIGHETVDWFKIGKEYEWSQDWKRSVFIPIPKKGNAKECSNYHTIAFISYASKVMVKILQARLQQYVNQELSDVQAGFRKGKESEIKLPTSDRS